MDTRTLSLCNACLHIRLYNDHDECIRILPSQLCLRNLKPEPTYVHHNNSTYLRGQQQAINIVIVVGNLIKISVNLNLYFQKIPYI